MQPIQTLGFTQVHRSLTGLCDGDMHAKRVLSLANATLGVIRTASLPVNTIGQGLTLARGLVTQDAIKPVDRLLSNEDIDVDAARGLGRRVRFRELRLICGLIPLKASPWHVPRSSHGRRQAATSAVSCFSTLWTSRGQTSPARQFQHLDEQRLDLFEDRPPWRSYNHGRLSRTAAW